MQIADEIMGDLVADVKPNNLPSELNEGQSLEI